MDALALFGRFAVSGMLVSYALENRSHWGLSSNGTENLHKRLQTDVQRGSDSVETSQRGVDG
jgi:hypothetical protein